MSAVVNVAAETVEPGSLEERYRASAAFRAASDQTRVTPTHIHIAVANGLGWGFDGMDGVIFALASPLVIKEFGLTVPDYRSGLQIALLVGIVGMFVWPWLADRYGRRTLLAINIALFSLLMPVLALCQTWAAFVAVRCAVNFALNGEWALGSMLVAETWPARLRGRVIGINRGTWCFGAALAGAHRHLRHRRFRLARRVHRAVPGGADRRLCPRQMPGIALLGAHAGPQGAHRPHPGERPAAFRRGPGVG